MSRLLPGDSSDSQDMVSEILRHPNYQPGSKVNFSFPGGISPAEAPVSSIPMPSASIPDNPGITLPDLMGGVRLAWNGPLWDSTGAELASDGEQASCMRFFAGYDDVSESELVACADQPTLPADATHIPGQVYTGPWDAKDGVVNVEWVPGGEDSNGQVVLNIRLLGAVDVEDEFLVVERVRTSSEDTPKKIQEKWDNSVSNGVVSGDLPDGFREALACEDEENIEYVFNPALGKVDEDGNLIEVVPTLQGDPNYLLAEVSCLLEDDGSFDLTMATSRMRTATQPARVLRAHCLVLVEPIARRWKCQMFATRTIFVERFPPFLSEVAPSKWAASGFNSRGGQRQ